MSRRPPARARAGTSHSSSSGPAAVRRGADDDDDEQEVQEESGQEDASGSDEDMNDAADSSLSADDADREEEEEESELRLDRRHPSAVKRPCAPYLSDGRRSKNATEKQFNDEWKPEHGPFFWMFSCLTRDPTKPPDFRKVFIAPANDEEKATNKASKRSLKEYEQSLHMKAAKDSSLKLFRWRALILLGDTESDVVRTGSGVPQTQSPSSAPAPTKAQYKVNKVKKTETASPTPATKGNKTRAVTAAGGETKHRSGVRQDVPAAGAAPATTPNAPAAATTRSKARSLSSGAAREDAPASSRDKKQNLDKKTAPSRSGVRSRANEDSSDEGDDVRPSRKNRGSHPWPHPSRPLLR